MEQRRSESPRKHLICVSVFFFQKQQVGLQALALQTPMRAECLFFFLCTVQNAGWTWFGLCPCLITSDAQKVY